MKAEDVIIIGAGPCGLSAAAELQDKGFDPLIIEKENVVHSISCYPINMQFFSTPALLEIAGVPFITPHDKPSRLEALHYYRTVSERRNLRIRRYEKVTAVEKTPSGEFVVRSVRRGGEALETRARAVIVATGYFDHPNRIGIPGEDLPHVTHFFREAHPYAGTRVVIIGGSNSAVDAALEMERVGAKVTVVYRGESVSANIKPWVRPLFEGLVNKGRIELRLQSRVTAIRPEEVTVQSGDSSEIVGCDFVLALTGFRPDRGFLRAMGVHAPDGDIPPTHDPETMETNVPGLYLAGVVSTGRDANEIFIESGRFHGRKIAAHLAAKN
ncbi:YpdA family putative bacillithiol disulfide reductase [Cohnella candidum]|uniref:YpdA family putative bacillithiol disulfide reductase n=1 Tax=Cohnella candidum TaxID=2674991 RepID=A0A3G3K0Z2_9BACL|nr:YpdA family putative bacillithiol disulfide reductase [Cohnella candidum]AYQ74214.1 YpdA family putative bacillithiol disulfide reductase [Cohnella candidum]